MSRFESSGLFGPHQAGGSSRPLSEVPQEFLKAPVEENPRTIENRGEPLEIFGELFISSSRLVIFVISNCPVALIERSLGCEMAGVAAGLCCATAIYSGAARSHFLRPPDCARTGYNRLHGLRSVHMTNTDRRWPHNPTTSSLQCGQVLNTNSTAQGGGGSFKNRKPIGEIGCCESRMAERIHWWTKRWLECRIIHLSIYLSIHPSIYPSFLSTDLSACQPIHLSLFSSICLALYLSMQPSIHHPISVYAIFLVYVSKVFSCHEKLMPGHTKCCTCHAKTS